MCVIQREKTDETEILYANRNQVLAALDGRHVIFHGTLRPSGTFRPKAFFLFRIFSMARFVPVGTFRPKSFFHFNLSFSFFLISLLI